MNPLLIDLPAPIYTPRLLLRPPQAGDGKLVNAAVLESFAELNCWMPWAQEKPSVEDSEIFVRTAQAEWITREQLILFIFDKTSEEFLGSTGYNNIKWQIPSFNIGYWIRTHFANQGIITESTNALTRYAFKELNAARVAISCDEKNGASRRVAEKLGYTLEGRLLHEDLNPQQELRNTLIYARINIDGLIPLPVSW